jgi:hypothetical protein
MTLAHSGHWYHSILYLVPVLIIAAALWWSGRGERAEQGEEPPDAGIPAAPADAGDRDAPDRLG